MSDELVRVYTNQGKSAHLRLKSNLSQHGSALCGRIPPWFDPIGWRGPGAPFASHSENGEAARRPLCKQCEQKAAS